jgi:hypothetical protein
MLNLAWVSDVELALKKFKGGLSCGEAPGFIRDSALEITLSAVSLPFAE